MDLTLIMRNIDKILMFFQGQPIGELSRTTNSYEFIYLDNFHTLELRKLPGIYENHNTSAQLWPYFQARIPNYKSPVYERMIEEHQLSEEGQKDVMLLLATLGQKVVTDPFILEASQ